MFASGNLQIAFASSDRTLLCALL